MSWICISIENPLRSLFIHLYDILKLYYVIFIGSIEILKWGASSRWLTSLYYPMRNSDELTIIINVIIIWYNKLIWYKYNDIIYITFWYKIKISQCAQNWPQLSFSITVCLVLRAHVCQTYSCRNWLTWKLSRFKLATHLSFRFSLDIESRIRTSLVLISKKIMKNILVRNVSIITRMKMNFRIFRVISWNF